jgi:hypothetical protein
MRSLRIVVLDGDKKVFGGNNPTCCTTTLNTGVTTTIFKDLYEFHRYFLSKNPAMDGYKNYRLNRHADSILEDDIMNYNSVVDVDLYHNIPQNSDALELIKKINPDVIFSNTNRINELLTNYYVIEYNIKSNKLIFGGLKYMSKDHRSRYNFHKCFREDYVVDPALMLRLFISDFILSDGPIILRK